VVIPALNQMIDVTTSRATAALTHTPKLIMAMLSMLGLVCSLLGGSPAVKHARWGFICSRSRL